MREWAKLCGLQVCTFILRSFDKFLHGKCVVSNLILGVLSVQALHEIKFLVMSHKLLGVQ